MEHTSKITAGQVFYCPICGAEVTVVFHGNGKPAPVCCNQPMKITGEVCTIYYCPVCGAEVMVTKDGNGVLSPRCCNRPMIIRAAAA